MSSDVSKSTKKGEAARITGCLVKSQRKTFVFFKMPVYYCIILLQTEQKCIFRIAALSFDGFFGQFWKKGMKIMHVINVDFNGETARNSKDDKLKEN